MARDKFFFEIICHHKDKLSKLELEQILVELSQIQTYHSERIAQLYQQHENPGFMFKIFFIEKSKRSVHIEWYQQQMQQLFQNTTIFEPIPINNNHLPYVIEYDNDFILCETVKPQHQTVFKSSKLPPCEFMQKTQRSCEILNKKDMKIVGNRKKQEAILKHLSNYDHFQIVGKHKPMCPYHDNNEECAHFENVLNDKNSIDDNFDKYFQDYKHLYLYFHKSICRLHKQDTGSSPAFTFMSRNNITEELKYDILVNNVSSVNFVSLYTYTINCDSIQFK